MTNLPATFVKDFHNEELVKKMEYRNFGKTGLKISKIALGCGPLSDLYGEFNLEEAIKTIEVAIKSGVNYIDTAPYYGQGSSEKILGVALENIPRSSYYIATKVGRYNKTYDGMFDFSAKKTRESVEKSLKRMRLNYIDVIQIHDIEFLEDLDIVINDCLPELEKMVKEGKARYIGVTGYPISRLKDCIQLAPGRLDVVLAYARNTLLDDTLKEYIDFFKKENVGIVCAAAHALGLLTNNGPQPWHPAADAIKEASKKAADICKEANVELGKLATYYSMQFDGPTTILIGMQTRKLFEINLNVVLHGLTEKEQEILQLLQETVFTKSMNWEGIELERYRAAMNDINGNK